MSYELRFHPLALKEWRKLDSSIKEQFKRILRKRLEEPHVASARLSGALTHCYKIKLRKLGFRLVYQVKDQHLLVVVVAVGRRDKSKVYQLAGKRQ